eukprot:1308468-Amphidinium_carterae.1
MLFPARSKLSTRASLDTDSQQQQMLRVMSHPWSMHALRLFVSLKNVTFCVDTIVWDKKFIEMLKQPATMTIDD